MLRRYEGVPKTVSRAAHVKWEYQNACLFNLNLCIQVTAMQYSMQVLAGRSALIVLTVFLSAVWQAVEKWTAQ